MTPEVAMSPHPRLTLELALDRLPKVESHCHIEGTMRRQTLLELAARGRHDLAGDPREFYRYDSLDGFLRVFWLAQSCLETRDDWARLAYESVIDGAAHGVVYRESFFTPARHLAEGQELATIVAGLEEGLAAGEAETGTRVRLICDMDRAFGGAAGLEFVERLVELKRPGLGGAGHRRRHGLDGAWHRPRRLRRGLSCAQGSGTASDRAPGRK